MRYLLPLFLIAAACGDPINPDLYPAFCEDTGFQGVYGEMDRGDLDCDNFRQFAALSRQLMVQSGLQTDDELTALRLRTVILIRSTHSWIDPQSKNWIMGHNDGFGNIMLGNLGVLWHEEFHSVQESQCDWNTGSHAGWQVNGYYGLDNYFRFHTLDLREDPNPTEFGKPSCGLGTLTPEMVDRLRAVDKEWFDVDYFMKDVCRPDGIVPTDP